MHTKKILITGSSGLLGFNLSLYLCQKGYKTTMGQYLHSKNIPNFIQTISLDLRDKDAVLAFVSHFKPDVIINCAALTHVDFCEKEPQLAYDINANSCKNIVNAVKNLNCKIIHISTDQMWDGSQMFVTEEVLVSPMNFYAKSKYKGENYIKEHKNHLILRTNFFGGDLPWRRSFLGWIKDNINQEKDINTFDDISFTPISLPILVQILEILAASSLNGLFHLGGSERISKHQLALEYAHLLSLNESFIHKSLSTKHEFIAKRPVEMSMNCTLFEKTFALKLPCIEESLRASLVYEQLLGSLKIF